MNYDVENLIGKTVRLDNNNIYQIIWTLKNEEKNYGYFLNIHDFSDILICEILENNNLKIINDKNELTKIIYLINGQLNTFVR